MNGLPRSIALGTVPVVERQARSGSPRWIYAFVGFEFLCQLLLLSQSVAPLRFLVRVATFSASLAFVILLRGHTPRRAPAAIPLVAAMGILFLEVFHPLTSSLTGGIAEAVFNFAVVAPVFWAPRLRVDSRVVRNVFLMYWAFNLASAALGALQVYYPGSFQPAISTALPDYYLNSLRITLASGARVFRPMGLTDTPGGAGLGAFYCALLAFGHLLNRPRPLFRAALLASIGVSLFSLYICQVRSLLVLLIISGVVIGAVLALQGEAMRLFGGGAVLLGVAAGAFFVAVAVGGDAVTSRLGTLLEADPVQVYQANRGFFLQHTLDVILPEYPLGAGLARWGMVSNYFFSTTNWQSTPVPAEIEWTGWILDGGVPLVLAYVSAILVTLWFAVRTALYKGTGPLAAMRPFAAVLTAYDVGALALTFDSHPFVGNFGLDFWLLNSTLFAAAVAVPADRLGVAREPAPDARVSAGH